MATDECFERAVEMVLRHEGGYIKDPNDPGGATNYGISLRFLSKLGVIDPADGYLVGDVDRDGDIDIHDIILMTREDAIAIYRSQWWDRYGYARIEYEPLATKLLDLSVNMGPAAAHRLLQRSVNVTLGRRLVVDGILGPKSIACINCVADPEALLRAFLDRAEGFYRSLNQPRYLKGWLNRLYDDAL